METLEIQEEDQIVVDVRPFVVVKPKFTKENWQSGEGGESCDTGESE